MLHKKTVWNVRTTDLMLLINGKSPLYKKLKIPEGTQWLKNANSLLVLEVQTGKLCILND